MSPDDVAASSTSSGRLLSAKDPTCGYALSGSGRVGQMPSLSPTCRGDGCGGEARGYLANGRAATASVRPLETEQSDRAARRRISAGQDVARGRRLGAPAAARTSRRSILSNVEQYLRQDGIWDAFCGERRGAAARRRRARSSGRASTACGSAHARLSCCSTSCPGLVRDDRTETHSYALRVA